MKIPNPRIPMMFLILLATTALARAYYDPGIQRWINRDPIEEDEGENLYSFGVNAPSLAVEPDGLDFVGTAILPANYSPDPFCAWGCEKKLGSCMDWRLLVCSIIGGAMGGAQVYNKTGTKRPGGVAGGGRSGPYTSRTRLKYGRPWGRLIGRIPAPVLFTLPEFIALDTCRREYNQCIENCPRAQRAPPSPLILHRNTPPVILVAE